MRGTIRSVEKSTFNEQSVIKCDTVSSVSALVPFNEEDI